MQYPQFFFSHTFRDHLTTPAHDPPPDAGGEGVVAFGLLSSAFSSDLLLPAKQIHASRLHQSKRRNACGAFVGHAPSMLLNPA